MATVGGRKEAGLPGRSSTRGEFWRNAAESISFSGSALSTSRWLTYTETPFEEHLH